MPSQKLRTLLSVALMAAVLAFVLWRGHIWEIGDAVQKVSPVVALIVLALTPTLALPLALRENAILGVMDRRVGLGRIANVALYGSTISLVTPAAAGEVLRPRMLERLLGVPFAGAVALVVYERFYSYAIFGLTALAAFSLTVLPAGPLWAIPIAGFLLIGLLTPQGYVLGRSLTARLHRFLPASLQRMIEAKFTTSMAEGDQYLAKLTASKSLSGEFLLWTLATQGITVVQFWLICNAISDEISAAESWSILILGTGAGMLSLLPLGLGATDAVVFALATSYGADEATAAAIVLLYRVLIYLPSAIAALVAYVLVKRQERLTLRLGEQPGAS